MGYVVRLKRNQLVGGNNNDEIYPITSTNAVYRGGKNLEDILDELGRGIDGKKVTNVSYNKSTNSIKVSYSNGDVDDYTLIDCVKDVSLNDTILTFTKTDGTQVNSPKIIMIPTFGVDKGTYLAEATNLKNAIYSRNLNGLNATNDVCVYDFIDDGGERTAVMYPRLPKVVAAVSTNGDKLRITYLEDKETSGQSYTDIDLPSGGSNVTVNNKNATLNAGGNVTVATVTVDNSTTDLKVNVPNFVVNNNSIKNIEYCASESAYNSSSKDSNTLYFIPVS